MTLKKPASIGLIEPMAGTANRSSNGAIESVTFDWSDVQGADAYEVFGSHDQIIETTSSVATVRVKGTFPKSCVWIIAVAGQTIRWSDQKCVDVN